MFAELRKTCRGRASILGLQQVRAQASGFLASLGAGSALRG